MIKVCLPILVIFCLSCQPRGGERIPSFDLLLIDSITHFNTARIPEGNPVVLLYYSPDCEHCQKETAALLTKMDSLKNVRFYFITNDPYERMSVYNKMFKLYKYSNITLGRDYKYFFPGHFKNVAPPYMVICDEYKRVRGIFDGETTAEKIISFINVL